METDLRHATTIHFGQGETFQAVIVGDTESFQVDPIPEIGNILTIKPHVAKARTNMTVVTNRRTYSFDLVENAIVGAEFFEVRFDYPQDRRASASQSFVSKGAPAVRNASYKRAGDGDFAPARSMTTAVTPTSSFPRPPGSPRSSRSTGKAASAR